MAQWRRGNAVVCKTTMRGFESLLRLHARVAELADAIDLRSIAARRVGSNPTPGKSFIRKSL